MTRRCATLLVSAAGSHSPFEDPPARPLAKEKDLGAIDIRDGGNAIPYDEEDPFIRSEYEETLKREGGVSRMEDWIYEAPKEGEVRPMTEFNGM